MATDDTVSRARRNLLAKHPPSEVGYWEIRGEDPNADLGGSHVEPFLGVVHGEYSDVVDYALELRGFFSWGHGGEIKPIKIIEVDGKSARRVKELRAQKAQLEAQLHEVNAELNPSFD